MRCGCTSLVAQCEEGRELLAERQRAWDAWVAVSGTPRAEFGFREDYQTAKAAYAAHVRQAQERFAEAGQE